LTKLWNSTTINRNARTERFPITTSISSPESRKSCSTRSSSKLATWKICRQQESTPSLRGQSSTNTIRASKNAIHICECSRRTFIWTKQRRISISTLYRSPPGAIEVWKHEFRWNRLCSIWVSKARAEATTNWIAGYFPKRKSLLRLWSGTVSSGNRRARTSSTYPPLITKNRSEPKRSPSSTGRLRESSWRSKVWKRRLKKSRKQRIHSTA
jgi:Plasmid recombination enzyme.